MRHRLKLRQILSEKWKEALQAVLPIITIVLALSFTIAPLSPSVLLCFLMGAVLILVGMMFFTTGAETAMTPMGERIGTAMTKTKKLGVVITLSFLLGFIITVSEPDLQVLASQVPSVPNLILILSVACGVGVFLVVSLLRMLFSIALPPLLVGCYAVVFLLAFFVPPEFLAVAFDFGGLTQFGTKFAVSSLKQDGYTSGALTGINVGRDGSIVASYSNGVTRTEGQIALAAFTNTQGLGSIGNNKWVATSDSGPALNGSAQTGTFGSLQSGALEESNVDLTAELVNMMTAQRSYQANAQTIKTQDQVFSTLVNLR